MMYYWQQSKPNINLLLQTKNECNTRKPYDGGPWGQVAAGTDGYFVQI